MRKLMNAQNEVNEQEELLVHKLKSSILVDVKGMSEEIISGIQTAAYDILQEVFTAAIPQLVQENEILKLMLTDLSKQVSNLQREIYEMKVAKPLAFRIFFIKAFRCKNLILQQQRRLPTLLLLM